MTAERIRTIGVTAGIMLGAFGFFSATTAHAHPASLEARGATTIAAARHEVESGDMQARLDCAASTSCLSPILNGAR